MIGTKKIPTMLCVYQMTYKQSTGYTQLKLVYGQEEILPLHYTTNVANVSTMLKYDDRKYNKESLHQLQ